VSAVGDAMTAIRNVVLMQERIANMQKALDELSANVAGLSDYAVAIDKRVVRIETMIEMSRPAGAGQPKLEG
jgi:hypothetical protein